MSTDASPSQTPALEMRGAAVGSLRNPEIIVVEGVDWEVADGDFWVLAGLQGTGKSEFLMMAGSLSAPVAGSCKLFGADMPVFEEHRLPERLRLGFVFEDGHLLTHHTVIENVALPLQYHRNLTLLEAEAEARGLLERTGLADFADTFPGALTRNWRKRAGLARALALAPEILLLDNPLGGLDPRHARWWLEFLADLNKKNATGGKPVTIIATANDLRPWAGYARQFALIRDRRLTVIGNTEQLRGAQDALVHELSWTHGAGSIES